WQREAFRSAAAACGAGFSILAVDAPRATLRERVLRRAAEMADASDATAEVLERQLAAREALTAEELACAVRADTSEDLDPVAIGQALQARSTPPAMRA
ncbi:MAG TPA: AAA family ATPase, partial [Quisquiliibacterium sp.]|nr:AAA family ATPase [Quisquiliibacterium sp.]